MTRFYSAALGVPTGDDRAERAVASPAEPRLSPTMANVTDGVEEPTEAIDASYAAIVSKLPKKGRPVQA
jgi:hypothetical protein